MTTHPRAIAYIDAYKIDSDRSTIVDVDTPAIGDHRFVAINFNGKTWMLDFGHHTDHDFVDVSLFDSTTDVAPFHTDTADAEWNPDGPSTPIGVFGMQQGAQLSFPKDAAKPTNHGWPAAATITLLADHPDSP